MIVPVIIYILFLIVYIIFALFAIYHVQRFGFIGDATKYVSIIFVILSLAIIIFTGFYIFSVDWSQSFDLSIFNF
ncbi:hypothetical protein ACFLZS_00955 [Patescibacteria group bacterium]